MHITVAHVDIPKTINRAMKKFRGMSVPLRLMDINPVKCNNMKSIMGMSVQYIHHLDTLVPFKLAS